MITGTLVGVVSGVVVLAPSVLAVFGSASTSTWPDILISTAILLIMVVIAIVGVVVGIVLMFVARFVLRSSFFRDPLESAAPGR
jgi:beta-lactamase regulating signal transducer with metallopeptidase domain